MVTPPVESVVRFYRVCLRDDSREGMYRPKYDTKISNTTDRYSKNHISPYEDCGIEPFNIGVSERCRNLRVASSEFFFGFESLSSLREWVYAKVWRTDLEQRGFVIREFTLKNDGGYTLGGNLEGATESSNLEVGGGNKENTIKDYYIGERQVCFRLDKFEEGVIVPWCSLSGTEGALLK